MSSMRKAIASSILVTLISLTANSAFAQLKPLGGEAASSPTPENTNAIATTPPVSVFVAGHGNHFKSIRIPALVTTNKGTLLAFAEGRMGNRDQSQNKLILSRSTDNGKTWSAVRTIWNDGKSCINNPTAVVDRTTGDIFVIVLRFPPGTSEGTNFPEGVTGKNLLRNFILKSSDDGVTWSKPRDVTATTRRPVGVKIMAPGPGIGIQLTRSQYKGRLIFPFSEGIGLNRNLSAVYSDDDGKTWHLGQPTPHSPKIKPNENTAVELSDGSVMFNARHQNRGKAVRTIAISTNGGLTWGPLHDAPALYDPTCEGSALRYSFAVPFKAGSKNQILYCAPGGPGRKNGTVYLSTDNGKTWPQKKLVVTGGFSYSSMTRLANGEVGLLYEQGGQIKFTTFAVSEIGR